MTTANAALDPGTRVMIHRTACKRKTCSDSTPAKKTRGPTSALLEYREAHWMAIPFASLSAKLKAPYTNAPCNEVATRSAVIETEVTSVTVVPIPIRKAATFTNSQSFFNNHNWKDVM